MNGTDPEYFSEYLRNYTCCIEMRALLEQLGLIANLVDSATFSDAMVRQTQSSF